MPVGGHFHNTRNTGYANALAALEAGAVVLDASVGGLGGCPFAPNATGNIATEDLVYALEREGVETGVDLDALIDVADWVAEKLGRPLDGQLYRAGRVPVASGLNRPAHLAELDVSGAAAQHHLVAVLEEGALRSVVQAHGPLAVPGQLDERAFRSRRRRPRSFPTQRGRRFGPTRRSRVACASCCGIVQ